MKTNRIYQGDALAVLKTFPDESIDMVITSPPYWALRDYDVKGQLGLEPTFQEYINKLCNIFDEVKRVLKKEGTAWINLGDTYMNNSSYSEKGRQGYGNDKIGMINKNDDKVKTKSLCQIPSRFAIEMTDRGWILRNEIIWHKPNCMPSSAKDRFTVDFEKIFFFVKNKKYWFERQFEKQKDWGLRDRTNGKYRKANLHSKKGLTGKLVPQGRNKRTVWRITTKPYKEAHFAVYPPDLIETPIKAGCPEGGIVLDPFFGSGTTGLVAQKLGRNWIGIELNKEYISLAKKRLQQKCLI